MHALSKRAERRRKKDTRLRIMSAGRKIFSEKGLVETKIQDLLKTAGVSPGAFYNYFSNKEDLFLELVREAGEGLRKSVQEIRTKGIKLGNQDELFLVLRDSIKYFFEFVAENRAGLRILLREQQSTGAGIMQDTLNQLISEIHQDLKRDIQTGINMGIVSITDPGIAAWGIISAIAGVMLAYINDPKINRDQLCHSLAELLLLGLFPR